MRGKAVHKNHNPTLYINIIIPHNHVFIVVACPAHILSKKGIDMKLGFKMAGSERKCSTQEPQSYPVYWQSYLSAALDLYAPHMGEAYSRRFVRLSVSPVHCPANNFKTTVGL